MPQHTSFQKISSTAAGFWLVVPSKSLRIWLAASVEAAANCLDDAIGRHAGVKPSWWIDRCLGPDVDGNPAWVNLDHAERLLECLAMIT
jgi:hypothetical protein